ncbi:MAG: hypothetical protein Q4C85_07250 [Actinomyces sp.]|uniref:hypothetical protein n=1 Tax=Actinomyces sp. TaxID=29317 RepID=UPI0026DAFF14|nr:hypothetical protein [Actinomyces sp.]MDO4243539.1 hypothetical protein [Actinomyces sp.]
MNSSSPADLSARAKRDPDYKWPCRWPSFEEILSGTRDRTPTGSDVVARRCIVVAGVLLTAALISYHAYNGAFRAQAVCLLLGAWTACTLMVPVVREHGAADAILTVAESAVAGWLLGVFYRDIVAISPWIAAVVPMVVPLPRMRVSHSARNALLGGFLLVSMVDVALIGAGAVGPWGLRGESAAVGVVAIIIAVCCWSDLPGADLAHDVDQHPRTNTWDLALRVVLCRVWIFVEIATLLGLLWG